MIVRLQFSQCFKCIHWMVRFIYEDLYYKIAEVASTGSKE